MCLVCLERAYLLEFTRLEGNLILKICQKFTPGSLDRKSRDFIRGKTLPRFQLIIQFLGVFILLTFTMALNAVAIQALHLFN